VQTSNARLKVDLRDRVIARLLYLDGEYEREFHQLFRHMDLQGSVCVDIGANLGLHTVELGKVVGGSGSVFSFEPSAHNFSLLQENIALNGLTNVNAVHAALSDTEGSGRLALSETNFGDHQIAIHHRASANRCEEVRLISGDSVLSEVADQRVKLIKIDVQGHEYRVLQGLQKTLSRNRDVFVMIEVAPGPLRNAGSSGGQVMQWMKSQGFVAWEFHPDRVLPASVPWAYDLIHDDKDVNVIVCRDENKLISVLEKWRGYKIPRGGNSTSS
jgi:FkbM family methyltransferase